MYDYLRLKRLPSGLQSKDILLKLRLSPRSKKLLHFFLYCADFEFILYFFDTKYYVTIREMKTSVRLYQLYGSFCEYMTPDLPGTLHQWFFHFYCLGGLISESTFNVVSAYLRFEVSNERSRVFIDNTDIDKSDLIKRLNRLCQS